MQPNKPVEYGRRLALWPISKEQACQTIHLFCFQQWIGLLFFQECLSHLNRLVVLSNELPLNGGPVAIFGRPGGAAVNHPAIDGQGGFGVSHAPTTIGE